MSDSDVKSYKQIKDDLDGLRLLVEKSELWVFKAKSGEDGGGGKDDEDGGGGGGGDGKGKEEGPDTPRTPRRAESPSVAAAEQEEQSRSVSPMLKSLMSSTGPHRPRQRPPMLGATDRQGSAIDLDIGPPLEVQQTRNYKSIQQILARMNRLCVQTPTPTAASAMLSSLTAAVASATSATGAPSSNKKPRKHEQRLLRNMGAHAVVLDLLQIPYDQKEDVRMNELMRLAHEFLQNFCLGNVQNQALLHKRIDLFLTPGLLEAQTMCAIFRDNAALCNEVSEKVVQHFVHSVESHGKHVQYLRFLQTIVRTENQFVRRCQDLVMQELVTAGEDVLVFYNDKASFNHFVEMMRSERNRMDDSSPLRYHIELVRLLSCCTMGKNVYTEIKCHLFLPLDDIVNMVCHRDTIPEVKEAYVNFLTHCYIDTEVEMKEIYTSSHMWQLFERSFLLDMGVVSNATHDRRHADLALEHYVTETLMDIVTTFFKSPFLDQSITVQVR